MNYLKKNFINLLILVTGCISVIYINNKAEDVLEVSSSEIITIPDKMPSDIFKGKKLLIGFDPNLFTD